MRRRSDAIYRFRASELFLGKPSAATFAGWAARELKIQLKNPSGDGGRVVPFRVNAVQYDLLKAIYDDTARNLPVRYVILKARQFGVSTIIQAVEFKTVTTEEAVNAVTVAHKAEATATLHQIFDRFLKRLAHRPLTQATNKRGVTMADPWDSRIRLETAEAKEVGRSTMNRIVHMSELAFWPFAERGRLGLVQTVGDYPGTMIFEESTANGLGNLFHNEYKSAKARMGRFKAFFYPWHVHAEYRHAVKPSLAKDIMSGLDAEERMGRDRYGWDAEQILWRRLTIHDKCGGDVMLFHQEYPADDTEAFLTSGAPAFDLEAVQKRLTMAQRKTPYVGVLGYHDGDTT